MKLPYGYVLVGKEIVVYKGKPDVIRSILEYYLAGDSLGKIVDMLFAKGIPSPTGKSKWTRAAEDKLLANKKYVPIVGVKVHLDAQFEKNCRCNVDYDKAGHPRKATRYQSSFLEIHARLINRQVAQITMLDRAITTSQWRYFRCDLNLTKGTCR